MTVAQINLGGGKKPDLVRLGALNVKDNEAIDIDVKRFINHPEFEYGAEGDDIALIELITPVIFDKVSLRPACLQQTEFSGDFLSAVRDTCMHSE